MANARIKGIVFFFYIEDDQGWFLCTDGTFRKDPPKVSKRIKRFLTRGEARKYAAKNDIRIITE